jgi:hypothetical protein
VEKGSDERANKNFKMCKLRHIKSTHTKEIKEREEMEGER